MVGDKAEEKAAISSKLAKLSLCIDLIQVGTEVVESEIEEAEKVLSVRPPRPLKLAVEKKEQ